MRRYPSIDVAIKGVGQTLLNSGVVAHKKTWHQQEVNTDFFEALFVDFECPMPQDMNEMVNLVKPNLPWAYEHFKERVSGTPFNPPPSHAIWPFAKDNNKVHRAEEKFSHTYPERMWPKRANGGMKTLTHTFDNEGIRYKLGDLDDLVNLFKKDPCTRQGYLPIWFPEDTGAVDNQRVPCTLGYHFVIHNGYLHLTYYMRSCDYLGHFRDDIYLAIVLANWVRIKINPSLQLGLYRMDIINLHIFPHETKLLRKQLGT